MSALYKYETETSTGKIYKYPQKQKAQTNKKKGKKSEVYPFELEDLKNVMDYFISNEMWIHYLISVLSCNMARRINDTLSLTWENLFNPATGNLRTDILEIVEDKTDKLANPRINTACRNAIFLYIEKTGVKPQKNYYHEPVFMQLTGTYRGSVITDDGFRKALKKAAAAVGVEYNVGSHSLRKTFGKLNRALHPNDYDSMEILQTIYNHSDTKTTKCYIGLTKEKVNRYYEDMGEFFDEYVVGKKEFSSITNNPIVSLDINDLRDIIALAYSEGRKNAETQDTDVHIGNMNEIMSIVDSLIK